MKENQKINVKSGEILYYLEEMIQMNLAEEVEENVYYDLKYKGKCKRKELSQVVEHMKEWQEEKF